MVLKAQCFSIAMIKEGGKKKKIILFFNSARGLMFLLCACVLQALQQQIASKQGQFDELQSMAAQVQGSDARLNNYSSQLISKYEAVKNTARVSDGSLNVVGISLAF